MSVTALTSSLPVIRGSAAVTTGYAANMGMMKSISWGKPVLTQLAETVPIGLGEAVSVSGRGGALRRAIAGMGGADDALVAVRTLRRPGIRAGAFEVAPVLDRRSGDWLTAAAARRQFDSVQTGTRIIRDGGHPFNGSQWREVRTTLGLHVEGGDGVLELAMRSVGKPRSRMYLG